MYTFLSLSISILLINLYKNILSGLSNFKKFSINSSNSFSSFVLFLVALYLLVKNNRILKKLDLYLNDAILVSAKVERWDKIDISYKI